MTFRFKSHVAVGVSELLPLLYSAFRDAISRISSGDILRFRVPRSVTLLCVALLPLPGSLSTPTLATAQVQDTADFTVLDAPGAFSTFIKQINDSGEAVGDYIDKNANIFHFLYSGTRFSTINFGIPRGTLIGINNSGQILFNGAFVDASRNSCGVLLGPGGVDICAPGADLGCCGTQVSALNDSGQVAGSFLDAAGEEHIFIYSAGTYSVFDAPGHTATGGGNLIKAMNASGQVAGWFFNTGDADQQGFILSGGNYTFFGSPAGLHSTQVLGINASGQVVGYALDANNKRRGYVFSKGSLTTIDAPNAGPTGTVPQAINDSGQVAGYFFDKAGVQHGFLLSGSRFEQIDMPGAGGDSVVSLDNSGEVAGVFSTGRNVHSFVFAPCLNAGGDTDGDGLCDEWEKNGIRDANGNMLLDLPAMGADPNHKDIFVEIDYMDCALGGCAPGDNHTHFPDPAELQDIVNAFDTAPVNTNPDGKPGIHLHLMVDEAVPHVPTITWDSRFAQQATDFSGIKLGWPAPGNPCGIGPSDGHFGTQDERFSPDCQAILEARARVFHYALIAHNLVTVDDKLNFTHVGGLGDEPGNDLVIAPGGAVTGNDPLGYMESQLMHELGHNLNLGHGGGDEINCKPNYLSIMNYSFAYRAVDPFRPLDYSRKALPTLDKEHLNELLGIQGPPNRTVIWGFQGQAVHFDPAFLGPRIDWNFDGSYDTDVDDLGINWIDDFGCTGEGTQLNGYDDWANLFYDFSHTGALDATFVPSPPQQHELTEEEVASIAQKYHSTQDTTPPTTMISVTPQPNAAGWNNTNVTVTLNATDNAGGSGVKQVSYGASGAQTIATTAVSGASTVINLIAEGKTTITYFATDVAGNAESPHMLTVQIDKTPPTINATATPPPNVHGWNNTDVTVSFACSDSLSGLAPNNPPAATVLSSEGIGQSVTGTCTDIAGNSASATVANINIDKTPPTIVGSRTPLPNANGWNNTDVTVSFACSDSLSGIDTCGPENQVVSSEGTNQSRTGTAVDLAGNIASTTVSGINIDKTPPTMNCSATPNVLWPPNHKLVNVTTNVLVSDSLSGPAGFNLLSLTSNEPDSGDGDIQGWLLNKPSTTGQLRAERLGTGTGRVYTFVYQGADRAGNTATCAPTVVVPHDQGH